MAILGRNSARRARLLGWLRVGAYVSILTVGVGALSIRAARAEFANRSVEVGRKMAELAQATQNDVNKVSMNGQKMWIGSSVSSKPVKNILDGYEIYCKDNAAHSPTEWQELGKKTAAEGVNNPIFSTGVLRGGSDTEGAIVCFTKGEAAKASFAEAFAAFGKTGELGAFGALRYVYASKTESGNTLVLTAWTDDKFNVAKFMPEEGHDAAGYDFPGIPRIPDDERVFSSQVEGTPFGANVYRSKLAPSKVASFYDEKMRADGWEVLEPPLKETSNDGTAVQARLYERDGVVLTLTSHSEDSASFTSLGLAGVSADDRFARDGF